MHRQDLSTCYLPGISTCSVNGKEAVMLSPRFIPKSVFYTQSVMLSPRFIPESVFYTQSVVRSPCFILTAFKSRSVSPQVYRPQEPELHLLQFITRKYAFICVNWRPIARRCIQFTSAKKRTFARNSDSITIFAFLFTFNNIFICSYASFGIQKRKIYFHLRYHSSH